MAFKDLLTSNTYWCTEHGARLWASEGERVMLPPPSSQPCSGETDVVQALTWVNQQPQEHDLCLSVRFGVKWYTIPNTPSWKSLYCFSKPSSQITPATATSAVLVVKFEHSGNQVNTGKNSRGSGLIKAGDSPCLPTLGSPWGQVRTPYSLLIMPGPLCLIDSQRRTNALLHFLLTVFGSRHLCSRSMSFSLANRNIPLLWFLSQVPSFGLSI